MPLSDAAQQRALKALQPWHDHPVQLDLNVPQLTMLIGALQLALRHPHVPATSRRFLSGWLEQVIRTVATLYADLETLLRAGNDPAHDGPIGTTPRRPGPAPSLEIRIQPTGQLTEVDDVPCRVWQGQTGEGIACVAFVRGIIVVPEGQDSATFARALQAPLLPGRLVDLLDEDGHG